MLIKLLSNFNTAEATEAVANTTQNQREIRPKASLRKKTQLEASDYVTTSTKYQYSLD